MKLNEKERKELKKYRTEIITESMNGKEGKYTKIKNALIGVLGRKGDVFVENIKFTLGESNYKIQLPTMNHLKICRSRKPRTNGNLVDLFSKEFTLTEDETLEQLQLMVTLANSGRIINIECMEMFRMKLGGKKQDLNTR